MPSLVIEGGIGKHVQDDAFWSSIHIYDYSSKTEATLGNGNYFEYTCSGSREVIRAYADVDLPCKPTDTVFLRIILNNSNIAYSGYVRLHPTIQLKSNSLNEEGLYSIAWNFNEYGSIHVGGFVSMQDSAFRNLGHNEIDTNLTGDSYSVSLPTYFSDSAFYRFKFCSIHTWVWYGSRFTETHNEFKSSSLAFSLVRHDSLKIMR